MKFLATAIAFGLIPAGFGQIIPEYDYNGVLQPFWVNLAARRLSGVQLRLLSADGREVGTPYRVQSTRIDLASAFPNLWIAKIPRLLYCQEYVDGKPFGSGLVMQPMTNPEISRLKSDGKTVEFVPDEDQAYAGIRAWPDRDIEFVTSAGNMRFAMRPDCAPNTVWNIMHLVAGGFYRNVIWHRVVANSRGFPFVIQGGDPTGTGNGGPGFAYPLEDSPLPHDLGVISIARSSDPNTNGCQVFVCLSRQGTARLDHKYASFGQCVEGLETIKSIAGLPVGKEDRPFRPPVIYSARLVAAPPTGSRQRSNYISK